MNRPASPSIYDQVPRVRREKCWCGSTLSRYNRHENYGHCGNCDSFVLREVPDPRVFKELYSLDNYWRYRQKEIKGHPTIEERTQNDLNDGRVRFWLDTIHQHTTEAGVAVEAGCGHGVLLSQLHAEGWKTVGVEVHEETAHWVRQETGLDVRVGIFPEVPLPSCDLFLALDVIEHASDPVAFAAKIFELLNGGGIAIIQTPLHDGKQDPPFAHRFPDVFDDIEHLFVFNRDSIGRLVAEAGFTVLSNHLAWQPCHEILVVSKGPERKEPKRTSLLSRKRKARLSDSLSPGLSLGNVEEIENGHFRSFMAMLNGLAERWGLRTFVNWSKVWEYPWVWFNGLSQIEWKNCSLLDIGSELSPMPWFLASLSANVTLTETGRQWIPQWQSICALANLPVHWQIVSTEELPFVDESFDVVTSFSVLEHQGDKKKAVNEVARVLKPGGLLAVSFDICEPQLGMTFPEWNGKALTMAQFEDLIWDHPAFATGGRPPEWNRKDIPEFITWHLQSAPHHNYTVGGALLRKRKE
jgi:2-polyprenyl-3-methyl-5-hydroxy-6-metoxy-1,4-benzoquinol methylase